jgi:hypothetical protein
VFRQGSRNVQRVEQRQRGLQPAHRACDGDALIPPMGVCQRQRGRPADRLAPPRTMPRIKFLKFKRLQAFKSLIYRRFSINLDERERGGASGKHLILKRDHAFIR